MIEHSTAETIVSMVETLKDHDPLTAARVRGVTWAADDWTDPDMVRVYASENAGVSTRTKRIIC